MKLTEAQRAWLRAAQTIAPLDPGGMVGSSYRCVQRMIGLGLLEVRFISGQGDRCFVSDLGRKALNG